ncbi:hypothetical protein ACT3SP_08450 [Brachybacterium sp. AOP43-C2-M15]|uniref:hypothetical protein n=1 Tax=Brachybacterium sp. AOP43-C2-M15 TaxID=3457661 RepID=UPI0040343955
MHSGPSTGPRTSTAAGPLSWPLILGLGLLALARPISNTVLDQLGLDLGPMMPLLWTAVITVVWVAAVGLTRTARPVLTLTLTGIAYAVCAMILSGVLSPLLLGHLAGPLANPIAIVPILATNALWGVIAGLLALAVQRLRTSRPEGRA